MRLCAFVLGGGKTGGAGAGGVAELSVEVDLAAPGAAFELDGLFVGSAIVRVFVRHLAPHCTSRQLIKGIVGGSDRGEFSGRILVAPGALHTDARQHSRNIQLTDTATIVARPELEIYADDVKCAHGATVGQLDREAIYYMRQRGIAEADARRMQIEGFAMEIVDRLSDDTSSGSLPNSPSRLSRATIADKILAAIGE